ncbi:hypothetical protein E9993_12350 [Labilibacter sediminis]|nr:hypothetical protein E9993_12350 [Labilibacter sediminis]
MNQLFKDYNKTKKLHTQFKKAFTASIIDVVLDFHPHYNQIDILNELILLYASEILNATEEVLDKDSKYSEDRKIEELDCMNRVINKESLMVDENDFSEQVHLKAKALVVNFFPQVIHLSNYGFRLLELNTKMYLYSFIAQFNSFVNNQ